MISLLSRFLITLLAYISSTLTLHYLGPAEYSTLQLLLSTLGLASVIALGNTPDSLLRAILHRDSGPLQSLLTRTLYLSTITFPIALFTLLIYRLEIIASLTIASLFLFPMVAVSLFSEELRSKEKVIASSLLSHYGIEILFFTVSLASIVLSINQTTRITFAVTILIYCGASLLVAYVNRLECLQLVKRFVLGQYPHNLSKITNIDSDYILSILLVSGNSLLVFTSTIILDPADSGQFLMVVRSTSVLSLGLTLANYVFNSRLKLLIDSKNKRELRATYLKRTLFASGTFISSLLLLQLWFDHFKSLPIQLPFITQNSSSLYMILGALLIYNTTGPSNSFLILANKSRLVAFVWLASCLPYIFVSTFYILFNSLTIQLDPAFNQTIVVIAFSLSIAIQNIPTFLYVVQNYLK